MRKGIAVGCGSPLGDLFYLADAMLYDSRPSAPPPAMQVGVGEDLRAQLYQLYGEGQITEEVFIALCALADRGQLRPADLAVHRALARRPHLVQPGDVALTNALRGIHSRLARLAEARTASAKVLADLEARQVDLNRRMAEKENAARASVETDEEAARARLTEKLELVRSHDRLVEQAEALRADLARLDDLRAQLEAKAAELEAVRARSRLNEEVLK